MDDGQGQRALNSFTYTYPPLWGPDSYNDGAGMHRVITAAQFIKGNMPLGTTADEPLLTDEEAYDVAGYINSFARPEKANKMADFPDRTLKPMSTSYGPWADSFSADQHKFGPYGEIAAFYKAEYGLNKSK
jgi:thiosulfate dehydrogenase